MQNPDDSRKQNIEKIGQLMAEIGLIYKRKMLEKSWSNEKDDVERFLKAMAEQISFAYCYDSALNIGSAGIIVKALDTRLGLLRALKFPRPRFEKFDFLRLSVEAEIGKLLRLNHQNIAKVYFAGNVEIRGMLVPFYIMEYIQDSKSIVDFLRDDLPKFAGDKNDFLEERVALLLKQAAQGIEYLHTNGIVHCDMKPDNLLVSQMAGKPLVVVTDLGYSKYLDPKAPPERMTEVRFTKKYAHPELVAATVRTTDDEANVSKIQSSALKPSFDLYSLGILLYEILDCLGIGEGSETERYSHRYFLLMSARLLDGQIPLPGSIPSYLDVNHLVPRLSKEALDELKYEKASDFYDDLVRYTDEYSLENDIPELNPHFSATMQIAGNKVIFTERVAAIVNHPSFARLGLVSQLGLTSLLYAGASHTRREHSLGAFANACQYVKALYRSRSDPTFKSIMRVIDINAVLIAALVHDLGQYPLAHDLEECDDVIFSHDALTNDLFAKAASDDNEEGSRRSLADTVRDSWGVDPDHVVRILSATGSTDATLRERILGSIVAGPIDVDRLDYLVRDSTHLGLSYGKVIDLDRLLQCLTVFYDYSNRATKRACIAITDKGRITAEAITFARYAMFTAVYWHHTNRVMKAMLRYAVMQGIDRRNDNFRDVWRDKLCNFIAQRQTEEQLTFLAPDRGGYTAAVHPGDAKMIAWLRQQIQDPSCQALLDMIRQRKLYKRLLVISYALEQTFFEPLYGIRDNWDVVEKLREELEDAIKQRLLGQEEQPTRKLDASPLILIDIPCRADPYAYDLEVIRLDTEESEAEASYISNLIGRDFDKIVGKIRIFAHPSCESLVRAVVTRHWLLGEIKTIYNKMVKKGKINGPPIK